LSSVHPHTRHAGGRVLEQLVSLALELVGPLAGRWARRHHPRRLARFELSGEVAERGGLQAEFVRLSVRVAWALGYRYRRRRVSHGGLP
jgi:hypothetical protein